MDPLGDQTLSFWTWFDIEPYWDYGFVQVSTDEGASWTSLENMYSSYAIDDWPIDPDTGLFLEHWESIYNNLPGFTGNSGGWVYMEFDLSAYSEQDVLIGFRYMTDLNTLGSGWYVDEVEVNGIALDMQPELGDSDFLVTFVMEKVLKHKTKYFVYNMFLIDTYEIGLFLDFIGKKDTIYMIISPINLGSDFDYTFGESGMGHPFKW